MQFVSLFSGIGGFEVGLGRSGHQADLLCEILPAARKVLNTHFRGIDISEDVTKLSSLPANTQLVVAGFPCQDLSQAGLTGGVTSPRSGLISHVFRLLSNRPNWVILENVPFMLHLKRGEAMSIITQHLELLGYRWAWRVVDTYGFGLPQRRERVFIVASLKDDPADVLLSDDAILDRPTSDVGKKAHGFYWTEGRTGLGWAVDAVPTLKNGSSVGIPSPPAILLRDGRIIKPDIRDTERLQGFPVDWTLPALQVSKAGIRWSLVGNAVSVPVAEWLGAKLIGGGIYDRARDAIFDGSKTLPRAARYDGNARYSVNIGRDPIGSAPESLSTFLQFPGTPLSERAASSFLARTRKAKLRFKPGFIEAVEAYIQTISAQTIARAA